MKTYHCSNEVEGLSARIVAESQEKASCLAATLFGCRLFEITVYETQEVSL